MQPMATAASTPYLETKLIQQSFNTATDIDKNLLKKLPCCLWSRDAVQAGAKIGPTLGNHLQVIIFSISFLGSREHLT